MSHAVPDEVDKAHDICALPLVRRIAATLDLDPDAIRTGDPLPRGWHVALFTAPTRQSELRPDGVGSLGVTLPDLGLPRLMAGGKRTRFSGDIVIGQTVRRRSLITAVHPKEGRSGRFVLVTMRHEITCGTGPEPVLVEEQDYVMREAVADAAPAAAAAVPSAMSPRGARHAREVVPDEALLFRYCAITFNAHRIHYDRPFAVGPEGYPALLVNGGLPVLMLLELYRAAGGRPLASVTSRNIGPLFCGRPMRLCAEPADGSWRLWAEDDVGRTCIEVSVEPAG